LPQRRRRDRAKASGVSVSANEDPHPPTPSARAPPSPAVRERGFPLPLLEDVLGDRGRGHCRGPAGVEGEMGDDLADLLLGDAVVEGTIEMADQLPLAAERDQGGDDDQAAVALLEAGALPDLAEEPFFAVV